MAVEVRTYSLALWCYAHGHTPLRAVRRGQDGVFLFPDAAMTAIGSFNGARELLNDHERRARRAPRAEGGP